MFALFGCCFNSYTYEMIIQLKHSYCSRIRIVNTLMNYTVVFVCLGELRGEITDGSVGVTWMVQVQAVPG